MMLTTGTMKPLVMKTVSSCTQTITSWKRELAMVHFHTSAKSTKIDQGL